MTPLKDPVSILMPVCNEIDVIEDVINEWTKEVMVHLPAGSELILDDCSNDGTEKILERLAQTHSFLRINTSTRDGYFNSLMRLYQLAKCPLIFFTDSDGQYVASEFWKIAAHIDSFDLVHGWKKNRQDPWYRVWGSKGCNILVHLLFKSKCVDVNSAFRLTRRHLIDGVLTQIRLIHMLPLAEMYILAEAQEYRIKNVPVAHRKRAFGKSRSWHWKSYAKECLLAFWELVVLRREISSLRRSVAAGKATSGAGLPNTASSRKTIR